MVQKNIRNDALLKPGCVYFPTSHLMLINWTYLWAIFKALVTVIRCGCVPSLYCRAWTCRFVYPGIVLVRTRDCSSLPLRIRSIRCLSFTGWKCETLSDILYFVDIALLLPVILWTSSLILSMIPPRFSVLSILQVSAHSRWHPGGFLRWRCRRHSFDALPICTV